MAIIWNSYVASDNFIPNDKMQLDFMVEQIYKTPGLTYVSASDKLNLR